MTAQPEWVPWPYDKWGKEPKGARCRDEWTEGVGQVQRFIHPDDVATDPDAELVEAIAERMWSQRGVTTAWAQIRHDPQGECWLLDARAALAVVREHEDRR